MWATIITALGALVGSKGAIRRLLIVLVLVLTPTAALAKSHKDHTAGIIIGVLLMVAVVAIGASYDGDAKKKAQAPRELGQGVPSNLTANQQARGRPETGYATPSNLAAQLAPRLDPGSSYLVHVYLQSLKVLRVEGPMSAAEVPGVILGTLGRAGIKTVTIDERPNGVDVFRTDFINMRSRQGRKIFGFRVVKA
ncbi:hypothetical protein [Solirhodobacter olei]|uniref:hypothetical protein n=1 Tax=Solirhodobacter olei TaxID=2493082 RepID=UPI000FD7753A|nr:hypothetical protein [Solirhodobacter olei]